ncbi:MAG: hypothetical protein WBA68_02105 [Alteraurantiacibacter sp.]
MRTIFGAVAAGAIALSHPAWAQEATPIAPRDTAGLPAELQAIDEILTGGLMNDPTVLDWDGYGDQFTKELVVDDSYPGGGAALRVAMGSPGEIYAGGLNVPLLAGIENGDIVTIGFFARVIETGAADDMGRVGVRFQRNSEPYPGFGDSVVMVGPEWGFHEVSAMADRSIPRNAIVALQFGLDRQVIEIGQAIVVSGTPTVVD